MWSVALGAFELVTTWCCVTRMRVADVDPPRAVAPRVPLPVARPPPPAMGGILSTRGRAHERDEELFRTHAYVFERAVKKQERRFAKEAARLRRERRERFRASDASWRESLPALRAECARRNALAQRRADERRELAAARRAASDAEMLALERVAERERRRAREKDPERYRADRARRAAANERPHRDELDAPLRDDAPPVGRFDHLLAECAAEADRRAPTPERAASDPRFFRGGHLAPFFERDAPAADPRTDLDVAEFDRVGDDAPRSERRREAAFVGAPLESAAARRRRGDASRAARRDGDGDGDGDGDRDRSPSPSPFPSDHPSPPSPPRPPPPSRLPLAAALCSFAGEEGRTASLGAPGAERGGLRGRYEQVKVFRDGDSLFHCARLAEIACQARSGSAPHHSSADAVAAVLRRGIRSLGQAQASATARGLREGAARRVARVAEDAEAFRDADAGGASDPSAFGGLSNDLGVRDVDECIAIALRGAEALNARPDACPPRGAPLDNWRRAMNDVGDATEHSEGRIASESGDYGGETSGASSGFAPRRRAAYCASVANPRVPSTYLEVAALAAHMKRPITIIRGPTSASARGAGASAGGDETRAANEKKWRARTETVGASHAARGREGFVLFWELAEGVPNGLPAGDFVLLVERDEDRGIPGVRGDAVAKKSASSPRRRSNPDVAGTNAARLSAAPSPSRASAREERDDDEGIRGVFAASRARRSRGGRSGGVISGASSPLSPFSEPPSALTPESARRGGASTEPRGGGGSGGGGVFAADPRTGETALHRAAASGSVTLVRAILRRAEVTGADAEEGASPGRYSFSSEGGLGGGVANTTALALLTRRDAHGATALDRAEAAGRVKTARLLRRELSKRGAAAGGSTRAGYGDAGYASSSSSAALSSDASDVSGNESSSDDFGGGYGSSGASSARTSSRRSSRRFTRSYDSDASSAGFWSDATPRSSVAGSDADAGSLWNSASESEGTAGSESEREESDGGGGGVDARRAPFPGGVRSDAIRSRRVVSLANGDAVEGGGRGRGKPSFLE